MDAKTVYYHKLTKKLKISTHRVGSPYWAPLLESLDTSGIMKCYYRLPCYTYVGPSFKLNLLDLHNSKENTQYDSNQRQ